MPLGIRRDDGADDAASRARREVAALTPLPVPGRGTWHRWSALADVAERDLSVGRLVEGHFDAQAILHELGHPDPGGLLGVWAARPEQLRAEPSAGGGWRLDGEKPFCSGSDLLDHALVTAATPDGPGLFLLPASAPVPVPGSWEPVGMWATRSETLRFGGVTVPAVDRVGGVDAYVDRPGFWIGGCGVAACWWGGARSVLADLDAHARAHPEIDAVRQELDRAGAVLRSAAELVDLGGVDRATAADLAASTRAAAADAGRSCLATAVAHLGTTALARREVGQRVADLGMYLTQQKPSPATGPVASAAVPAAVSAVRSC